MIMASLAANLYVAAFFIESTLKLIANDLSSIMSDFVSYIRLVSWLLYLTLTRHDLTYSVQALSQFTVHYTSNHFQAAQRVFRYIKATLDLGILLFANFALSLKAYSDSDGGGCIDIRRSVTDYTVFLGDFIISWKFKKHPN